MTEFKTLGPLEVIHNGRPCTPTAPKVGQVLALLLSKANHVVHIATLIDELWGDNPPLSAVTTAQTYIYQLRKLFQRSGPCGLTDCSLTTRLSGYVLRVSTAQIDSHVFLSAMQRGRALLEDGSAAEARVVLTDALSLWRGPVLVNTVCGRILQSYTVFMEESHVRTREMLISAEMSLGHYREVIAELQSLIVEYPLNEWFYARLIESLHRSDRRSEALQTFENLRRLLRDELGLEPSAEILRLQAGVLGGRTLRPVPSPALSAPGSGGRY
jgi:SARP family transcriptional regulator, regulator of embCAB operon